MQWCMEISMKKNVKSIIVLVSILLVIVGVSIYSFMGSKVAPNSPDTIGNTAGNLDNSGLFAENPADGRVYFSNIYDNGCLYSMNPNETDIKKVTGTPSSSILCGGDYIYCYIDTGSGGKGLGYVRKTYGIYRYKTNGSNAVCLEKEASIAMQLLGDYIYYLRYTNKDFTNFYKIKTDKSENEQASDILISPNCAYNGKIYYNGTEKDHYLYCFDTASGNISTIYKGDVWYPQYSNGYIYFMDVSSNYRLCRYNLSNQSVEILTKDRLDCYNVGQKYVYYQKSSASAPALMRIELDGSNPEVVANGIYKDINLTSEYCYFAPFDDDARMFRTPVYGSVNVSEFTSAREAVEK